MRLVLELTEMQLHHLESCLLAGRIQALDYAREHIRLREEDRAATWEKILDGRRELALIVSSAIEAQDCMGSFGDKG